MVDSSKPLQRFRTWVLRIEDIRIGIFLLSFVLIVLVFASAYIFLTPFGHGISRNFAPLTDDKIRNGIYLSLVTVSSLGYGDVYPIGISKFIASLEVLVGILFTGILIARVASRRLSYHASRLYSEQTQRGLDQIRSNFLEIEDLIFDLLYDSTTIQDVPRAGSRHRDADLDLMEFRSKFRLVVKLTHSKSREMFDTMTHGIDHSDYFRSAPAKGFESVGNAVDKAFYSLSQLLLSMPLEFKVRLLSPTARQKLSKSIVLQKQICTLVRDHLEDQESLQVFEQIQEHCQHVKDSFWQVPDVPDPDQLPWSGNDPQSQDGGDPVSI